MALTLPQIKTITNFTNGFDGQAAVDHTDMTALVAAGTGVGVVSGCTVSVDTSMTVSIAAGELAVGSKMVKVTATTKTIASATTDDRKDIIVCSFSGVVSVVKGSPCSVAGYSRTVNVLPPMKPAIPSTSVLLAEIYVVGSGTSTHVTTSIAAKNIVDKTATVTPLSLRTFATGYLFPGIATSNSGNTAYKGQALFVPLVLPAPFNVAGITVRVPSSTAGAKVRLGLYADNGHGKPGAKIADAGTVAGTSTGWKTATVSSLWLAPGTYWLCAVCQTATNVTLGAFNFTAPPAFALTLTTSLSTTTGSWWKSAKATVTGALPATAPTLQQTGDSTQSSAPMIWLKSA